MKGLIKVLEKKETNANEFVNNVNDIFMDVESEKYITPDVPCVESDFDHYPSLPAALDHLLDIIEVQKGIKVLLKTDLLKIIYDFNTNIIRGELDYNGLELKFAAPCVKSDDFEIGE